MWKKINIINRRRFSNKNCERFLIQILFLLGTQQHTHFTTPYKALFLSTFVLCHFQLISSPFYYSLKILSPLVTSDFPPFDFVSVIIRPPTHFICLRQFQFHWPLMEFAECANWKYCTSDVIDHTAHVTHPINSKDTLNWSVNAGK